MMNIQIDNPISILNQDVSRTFLVTSKPSEKYNLFMKATFLDTIENNYKEALQICEEEYERLKQYTEVYSYLILFYDRRLFFYLFSMFQALSQVRTEIQKLKENIHRLEEMDMSRLELSNLEKELQWATVSFSSKKIKLFMLR
jgi:DNA polymerase III gamma/tau subunit